MTPNQIAAMADKLDSAFRCGMPQALTMASAYGGGLTHAYEISWLDGTRSVGFGSSYDEVRKARIDEVNAAVALGRKPIGSHETNMEPYAAEIADAAPASVAA